MKNINSESSETKKNSGVSLNSLSFFIIIGFISAFAVFEIAFALPPITPYNPGQTLDPGCMPGSESCTVIPVYPITTEFATNTTVNMNNYSLDWGPGFVFFDSKNKKVGVNTKTPSQDLDVAGKIRGGAGLCIGDDCRTSWATGTTTIVSGSGISITGSAIPGAITFVNSSSSISADSGLYWDNVNKRLGIGTTTPTEKIEVTGNIKVDNIKTNGICFSDGCKYSWASIIGFGGSTSTGMQNTDNLPEGLANLYYSANRAIADVKANIFGGVALTPKRALTFDGTKIIASNFDPDIINSASLTLNKFLTFDGTKIVSTNYDGSSFGQGGGVQNGTSPNFTGLTITALTPGSIPFITAGGVISQDNGLYWDNVNKRLGIGTNNPQANLHLNGTIRIGSDGTDISLFKVVQASISVGSQFSNPQTAAKVFVAFPSGTIPEGALCIAHPPADLDTNLAAGQCQVIAADRIAVLIHSLGSYTGTDQKIWKFSIIK